MSDCAHGRHGMLHHHAQPRAMPQQTTATAAYQAVVAAPGFSLGICCTDDAVQRISFLPPLPEVAPRTPLASEVVRQLRAYLGDARTLFALPLQAAGTGFQQRVWQQIAQIPVGQTRSYGQLAAALHTAPRAVGQACAANPLPIAVPCHRVLAGNGGLGGFARCRDGLLLQVKSWLLAHERG